jgi:type I restriction enzyme M protein
MAKKKATNAETPQTTAQSLGSVVKSCRDIMRKDKGLNGDLDRLPMLTWIMFLKFLDDMEHLREQEASLSNERFRPIIAAPYRWRDWAATPDGITGPELIAFINQEKAIRADGKEGLGLFAYLRSLESPEGRGRQEVVANVFRGVSNRMESGYLLRDVLNKVHAIHFDSSEEIHTLSRLYESMLREMRDAAGDSGEFYTPRPVVQFMVEVMNPELGETVLDPACGTGGFLVEAFMHMSKQCKTTKDHTTLHTKSIFGREAKALPYLLSEMNLLLHGMEYPQIDYGNSLAVKVTEVGDRDRVDVILTNPPFGGEEETSIKSGFPQDMQTAETALLFLQLIMRMLRRPKGDTPGGRAAVVVPNGTLFGDGVCARIKEDLLTNFNLHTIVRLPNGVFTPYTPIPTNLLFFDRSGPTKDIWFYELPLPDDRKNFTKTKPVQNEDFANCLKWFKAKRRKEDDHAWRVPVSDILKYDANGALLSCNLDRKNPNSTENLVHIPPVELLSTIKAALDKSSADATTVVKRLDSLRTLDCEKVELGDIATLVKRPATICSGEIVRSIGVKWWGKGVQIAEEKPDSELRAARFYVQHNDLVYNDMWARHGSAGIVPLELHGCLASAHFPTWELDLQRVCPEYLAFCFKSPWFWAACEDKSQGSTGRNAITKTLFRKLTIPLPSIDEQRAIVSELHSTQLLVDELRRLQSQVSKELEALLPSILDHMFVGEAR